MSTETNATPGPGGISPARAACEAFWAAVGAGPKTQDPGAAWDWAFTQNTTRAWEAAAKAAVGAAERERAEAAEAKLAEIAALCREHPRTLTAEDVLRITGTGDEAHHA